MLTKENRLTDRVRHSNPDLQFQLPERVGRSTRVLSLEGSSLISEHAVHRFKDGQLRALTAEME